MYVIWNEGMERVVVDLKSCVVGLRFVAEKCVVMWGKWSVGGTARHPSESVRWELVVKGGLQSCDGELCWEESQQEG